MKKIIVMQSALLTSESKADLRILIDLARKLGIKTKLLTKEEIEDYGLARAMKLSQTGEYIDTDKFIRKLKKVDKIIEE